MNRKLISKLITIAILLPVATSWANIDYLQKAQAEDAYTQQIRNHLHEFPELSWQEDNSLQFIKAEIQKIKPLSNRTIQIRDVYKGGLVVDLQRNAKKTLLFRADIDALPILENPNNQPRSKTNGKMHACGHDAHSAMLLSALKLLATDQNLPLKHNIRFVWQRAEENPGTADRVVSGGQSLVQEGVLDGVDEVYGLHIWSKLKEGQLASARRAIMGHTAKLKIAINSSGGHTSTPHTGVNSIRVATAVMDALKDMPLRTLGPYEPVSLEPTVFKSGEAANVMPGTAEVWYSLRTFLSTTEQKNFVQNLNNVINSISQQFDADISAKIIDGYPATINNAELFRENSTYFASHGLEVEEVSPILAGEDFSYYLQNRKGVFWILGAEQPETGAHHSPNFNPSKNVFFKGVAMWLMLANK